MMCEIFKSYKDLINMTYCKRYVGMVAYIIDEGRNYIWYDNNWIILEQNFDITSFIRDYKIDNILK